MPAWGHAEPEGGTFRYQRSRYQLTPMLNPETFIVDQRPTRGFEKTTSRFYSMLLGWRASNLGHDAGLIG